MLLALEILAFLMAFWAAFAFFHFDRPWPLRWGLLALNVGFLIGLGLIIAALAPMETTQ